MKWKIKEDLMYNMTANPANKIYYTEINGTSNMTTVLNAPVIASKGHYYQIADGLDEKGITALIVDKTGQQILPDESRDDTYLSVERISGLTMEARQRLQMNFYIKKDNLYNWINNDFGFIIPLTFVKREVELEQSQVDIILEDLYMANKAKKILLAVFIVIGALLSGLGGFLLYKWKKIIKNEGDDTKE